jgi:hypothetical protein
MNNNYKASVLPTVIFVSILILSIVLLLFLYKGMHSKLYSDIHNDKKIELFLKSAFILQQYDSSIIEILGTDSSICLFQKNPDSKVFISYRNWGLYDLVDIWSYNKMKRKIWLYGRKYESKYNAAFWLGNNNKNLDLVGNTEVEGNLFVGNDISYSQIKNEYFSGKKIDIRYINKSTQFLPDFYADKRNLVLSFYSNYHKSPEIHDNSIIDVGFDEVLKEYSCTDKLSNINVTGNVILKGENIEIDSSVRLKDIIMVSNSVKIKNGFKGSVQIFAKDSVIVENKAYLEYPSGIYLENEKAGKIKMSSESEVNGYVIVNITDETLKNNSLNFEMSPTSTIRGLLFVNGIAQIQGEIYGSVFLKDSYLFKNEGYYTNILYNTKISKNIDIAYPSWITGLYERKLVKKLY